LIGLVRGLYFYSSDSIKLSILAQGIDRIGEGVLSTADQGIDRIGEGGIEEI